MFDRFDGYAYKQNDEYNKSSMQDKDTEIWDNFNNRLISILAHDLRQPFSSIIMTAEMMKLTQISLDPEELDLIMGDLKDTASKSIELLDGLLCWAKSRSNGFDYKTRPLFLNDLVNESNGLYKNDQQKKNIRFCNCVPERQVIHAHKQMLQFINRNILSNATKYSSANSSIRVSSEVSGNSIIVSFADQGIGMCREQIHKLFSMQENDRKNEDTLKGAGMAMSICKDMIRQMSGKIWAESKLGKGSTFYYSLPLEQ